MRGLDAGLGCTLGWKVFRQSHLGYLPSRRHETDHLQNNARLARRRGEHDHAVKYWGVLHRIRRLETCDRLEHVPWCPPIRGRRNVSLDLKSCLIERRPQVPESYLEVYSAFSETVLPASHV
jgi:hypothetical protein